LNFSTLGGGSLLALVARGEGRGGRPGEMPACACLLGKLLGILIVREREDEIVFTPNFLLFHITPLYKYSLGSSWFDSNPLNIPTKSSSTSGKAM